MTRKRRTPKTHYSLVDELFASDSAREAITAFLQRR